MSFFLSNDFITLSILGIVLLTFGWLMLYLDEKARKKDKKRKVS